MKIINKHTGATIDSGLDDFNAHLLINEYQNDDYVIINDNMTIEQVIDELQEHHGAIITKGYIHYDVKIRDRTTGVHLDLELTESELIDFYTNYYNNKKMTELEKLKQDLAELEVRIHSAMASDGNSISLTREQLKEFANAVQTYSFDKVKNEIEDLSIDMEDHVSLELNRLELEVSVATDDVLSDITGALPDPDEMTDNDVRSLLEGIKIYGSL